VAYLPALAVGGAVQLAAAHCPNERSFDPQQQLNRSTYAPVSRTMAVTPQFSPEKTHYFSGEYYQELIA